MLLIIVYILAWGANMPKIVISEEIYTPECGVRNVQGSVDENNVATVIWDWPGNGNYKFCLVFAVSENLSLSEILERDLKPTIYDSASFFGRHHAMVIPEHMPCIIYKIYPGRRLPNGDYEVLNQVKNNYSEPLYRRVVLTVRVNYQKRGMFAKVQDALISINGIERLHDPYICYRCLGGSRGTYLYPIDLSGFNGVSTFAVPIAMNEYIQIELSEHQQKYIMII